MVVADVFKEELMFMRKLQVYHEVLLSFLAKSRLKAIGLRRAYTNKGDAANPFIRARLVAQETKGVSEMTSEYASSTFAATLPLKSLKFMFSRCMIRNWRAPSEVKVHRFYDITRAHIQSFARRTIVIQVPREDGECKSGCAVLDKAMH